MSAAFLKEVTHLDQHINQLFKSGFYQEALPLAIRLSNLIGQHLGRSHPSFGQSLNKLGSLYYKVGDYANAEPLYRQAIDILGKFDKNHLTFAVSLDNLAQLYVETGKWVEAEILSRQALEIWREEVGSNHPDFAKRLNNLACLYDDLCEYSRAESLHQQALKIRHNLFGKNHPEVAVSLNNLGTFYIKMGRFTAAKPLLEKALEIRRTLGTNAPEFPQSLNALATLYYSMGDYRTAETFLRQTVKTRRQILGEKHPDFAVSLHNLAVLLDRLGNYNEAESLYQRALEIRRAILGNYHAEVAQSLMSLAGLYKTLCNYTIAESLYKEAIGIQEKLPVKHNPDLAFSLDGLASLYQSEKKIEKIAEALLLRRRALEIQRIVFGENHPDFLTSLSNMAGFYRQIRNFTEAEPLYQQVMEVRRKVLGKNHPDFASSLNCLGVLYLEIGKYVEAESFLREAMHIHHKSVKKEHLGLVGSLENLAAVLAATQRENEAWTLVKEAAAIIDYSIGQVFSIGSESQRIRYLNEIVGSFEASLSLAWGYFPESPNEVSAAMDMVIRRKAIGTEALATQRAAVLGGKYPEAATKLRDITMLRAQIAQKTLAGPGKEGLQTHQQLIAQWTTQKEHLEAELARQIPEMNIEQQLHSIDHQVVAMALPAGTALIEFVRFEVFDFKAMPARGERQWKPARYLAFVMPAGEPDNVEMIDLGEAEPIDQMIATFRSIITGEEDRSNRGLGKLPSSARRGTAEDVGAQLREAIFDPLLKALHKDKRLLISPDGDLTRLPFEVLPTDNGRRLIDDYRISYLGAGRDVIRFGFKSNRTPARSLVAADPNFDFGAKGLQSESAISTGRRSRDFKREWVKAFERLPGTQHEGKNIAAMLDAELWTDSRALDARLKQIQSPRILHLATHGFFLEDQKHDPNEDRLGLGAMSFGESGMERLVGARLENPLLRSGLALAGVNTWLEKGELMEEAEDGLLTAEDVSGLDLLDTELIVLSACETGLGEVRVGEGVFGLRRAFVLAGAKTLVMSLWKVPDEQTRELMEDFYRHILSGEPRAEALRQAQLSMKEKYPEPLYWGAFICQGDPGPLAQFG